MLDYDATAICALGVARVGVAAGKFRREINVLNSSPQGGDFTSLTGAPT